jgi:[protein-PII] uridylyltransferase
VSAQARWARTPFSERRGALLADESLQGRAFCRAHAGLVDQWLNDLFADEPQAALVAVGGYGRGELAPCSDLDLVLVHRGHREVSRVAQRIWYPIWDTGLALDHSVKTVKEALAVAAGDLRAALGLLDARTVAGDGALGAELAGKARDNWRRHRNRWLRSLGDAVAERHRHFGDVAFLLEPELKEGRGGLRDVHALAAAAAAADVIPDTDEVLAAAEEVLLATRVALQRGTGKASDRIPLQEQEAIAHRLGLNDADDLMRRVSAAARTIAWMSDNGWRRVDSFLAGPRGRVVATDRRVSPGVVLREGEIVVEAGADLDDESLALRVAAAAATTGAPIDRASLERLRTDAAVPVARWPNGCRRALVDLLSAGSGAIGAFEALDQYGLLVRLLPEWELVRSRRQHNPYHRFTVDRHLVEAAVQAAALVRRVSRPDLLVVAAWLHDLGKGYPGDHTAIGTELTERITTRLGFCATDVDTLVTLVRHHLLLAETATRRDVRDPTTIMQVAAAVGDRPTLELLSALTEADAKATGATAWTRWKAGLVDELVTRVASVLSGHAPAPKPTSPEPELLAVVAQAEGGLLTLAEGSRLVVVAPDRPGLFCHVAGVLALHGFDILEADAWSAGEGMAVDVFQVDDAFRRAPDWPRFHDDLVRAVDGRLPLESQVAERARTYATRRVPHIQEPATLTLDNSASEDASVVEVRASDAIGVLYRIARAFLDLELDIRHAKVQTLGHEVVDTFYLVDRDGSKLYDEGRIRQLEEAVLLQLSAVGT